MPVVEDVPASPASTPPRPRRPGLSLSELKALLRERRETFYLHSAILDRQIAYAVTPGERGHYTYRSLALSANYVTVSRGPERPQNAHWVQSSALYPDTYELTRAEWAEFWAEVQTAVGQAVQWLDDERQLGGRLLFPVEDDPRWKDLPAEKVRAKFFVSPTEQALPLAQALLAELRLAMAPTPEDLQSVEHKSPL